MPFSAGSYTLPPGTTATTLTPISSTRYNAFVNDVQATFQALWNGTTYWTGPFLAADGSVAAPGISFNSDTNTGIYRIGADNLGITLGGVKVLDLSTGQVLVSSADGGATAGPIIDLYRESASPAANDIVGKLIFNGRDSVANKQEYASLEVVITDATSTSEDAAVDLYAFIAGARTRYLSAGKNAAGTATANALGLPLGQLSFPATQNASSDANTFDDYEEGTWTFNMLFGGANVGMTWTSRGSSYTKIGNTALITSANTINAKGSSTGTITWNGNPFSSGGDAFATVLDSGNVTWTGLSVAGLTVLLGAFRNNGTGGTGGQPSDANITAASSRIAFSGSYITT